MHYTLTTIEQDEDGRIETRERILCFDLRALVALAHRCGWLPGAKSGTGLTIIETVFRSVP